MFWKLFEDGKNLIRDAAIVSAHLPLFPLILGTRLPLRDKYSEINPDSYDSPKQFLEMLYEALRLPCFPGVDANQQKYSVGSSEQHHDEKWYFLNGICTNEDMWRVNAKALFDTFGRVIHPLHNPSHGVIMDLLESMFGRTFDESSLIIDGFITTLEADLKNDRLKKVVIIAHSQGGIIASNLLKKMRQGTCGENSEMKTLMEQKLELYTFASAADEHEQLAKRVEHFANTLDFFTLIGAVLFNSKVKGSHYRAFKAGHLLNVHYLQNFKPGAYLNVDRSESAEDSWLYRYIGGAGGSDSK